MNVRKTRETWNDSCFLHDKPLLFMCKKLFFAISIAYTYLQKKIYENSSSFRPFNSFNCKNVKITRVFFYLRFIGCIKKRTTRKRYSHCTFYSHLLKFSLKSWTLHIHVIQQIQRWLYYLLLSSRNNIRHTHTDQHQLQIEHFKCVNFQRNILFMHALASCPNFKDENHMHVHAKKQFYDSAITSTNLPLYNKLIKSKSKKKCLFAYPFFWYVHRTPYIAAHTHSFTHLQEL